MIKHYHLNNPEKYGEYPLNIKPIINKEISKISINKDKYIELLKCKEKIDKYTEQWDRNKKKKNQYELIYVSNRNKYYNIANYLPISRSYFKLWEIFYDIRYNSDSPIKTSHIAEGPGGFIESTINYCGKNGISISNIDAITLKEDNKDVPNWNIEHSMIKDNNINIHYGKDGTGNIYNIQNILDFVIKVGKNSVDIITADGGFDYSIDYNKQEQLSYRLFLCELTIAVSLQKPGGLYVFKIFDISTDFTIQIIYILYKSYNSVTIVKPFSSRSANSEKYVVCRDFVGISNANLNTLYNIINNWNKTENVSLIDMDTIDESFLMKISKYNEVYIKYQINNINNTLKPLTRGDYQLQVESGYKWCKDYNMEINTQNKYTKILGS